MQTWDATGKNGCLGYRNWRLRKSCSNISKFQKSI